MARSATHNRHVYGHKTVHPSRRAAGTHLYPLLNRLAASFTMGFLSVTIPTSTSDLTCPSPTAVQSGVSSPTFISSMIPDVKGLAVEDGSHDETIGAESALASGFSSVQSVISFASTEDGSDPTVQNRCYWIDDNMVVLLVSKLPCTESNKVDIKLLLRSKASCSGSTAIF
jgi:hypothetical protein